MFAVFKSSGIEGSYSVSTNPLFVSNNSWSIYPAKHKTTNKNVSVWQFDKKEFENKLLRSGIINKSTKDLVLNDCYNNLKLYVSSLSKLKHPNVLTIIEPLEEHKSRLLFVSEYVINDLKSCNKSELDEIIISKGLLQISQGLKFLHQSCHIVHLNINPSSIVICENFDWKISSLQFNKNLSENNDNPLELFIDPQDSRLPKFLSIDFKFSSPNLLLKHNVDYIDDLFSLACIIFYLFNNGKYLIDCNNSSLLDYERSFNKIISIVKNSSTSRNKHALFEKIPDNYIDTFYLLLSNNESNKDVIDLNKQLTIDDFINSKIFNNDLIKILNIIDELPTLSESDKILFLRNLKTKINEFPKPLLLNKFIPIFENLLTPYINLNSKSKKSNHKKSSRKSKSSKANKNKNITNETEQLIVYTIENLLLLSNQVSQLTFNEKIYSIINITLNEFPEFISYQNMLIDYLNLIEKKLGASREDLNTKHSIDFKDFLLFIFESGMESNNNVENINLQEKILDNLDIFIVYQNYSIITQNIFPTISSIFSTTNSLKIKNLTIKSFVKLIEILEYFIIIEKLIPLIKNTSNSNFKNSKILINVIDLYDSIFMKLYKSPKDIITTSNNKEISVNETIMEIFFELWKLTSFINNNKDLNYIMNIISKIESNIKEKLIQDVKSRETLSQNVNSLSSNNTDNLSSLSLSPQPQVQNPQQQQPNSSTTTTATIEDVFKSASSNSDQQKKYVNNNDDDDDVDGWFSNDNGNDDDDEFGDFTTSKTSKQHKATRMGLNKQPPNKYGSTSASMNNTNFGSTKPNYSTLNSKPTAITSVSPFTTMNVSTPVRQASPLPQSFSVMQPMRTTMSPTTSTLQQITNVSNNTNTNSVSSASPGGIDWSKAASPSPTQSFSVMNPINNNESLHQLQQQQQQKQQQPPSWNTVMTAKKLNTTSTSTLNVPNTTNTQNGSVQQRDFFDSLI